MPRQKSQAPVKLTRKSVVDAALPPGKASVYLWDTEVRGFGLRVFDRGGVVRKSYIYRWTPKGKPTTEGTLGRADEMAPEMARQKAEVWRGIVQAGGDPRQTHEPGRTVADMMDRVLLEYSPKKSEGTQRNHKYLTRLIKAAIGKEEVPDLEPRHVAKLHDSLRKTERTANHAVALLSKACKLAEVWGWRKFGSSPVSAWRLNAEMFPEPPREVELSDADLARLLAALDEAAKPRESRKRGEKKDSDHGRNASALACIRLMLYSGMRKGEASKLQWADLRLDAEIPHAVISDHKTKKAIGAKRVVLGPRAVEILDAIPKDKLSPYIFPSERRTRLGAEKVNRPYMTTGLDVTWRVVRKLAGLEHVHLHDLRHVFVARGVAAGIDLRTIGRDLLGHTQIQTTDRYNSLDLRLAYAAMVSIGEAIHKAQ